MALRDELDGCIGCGCLRAVIARCVTRATAPGEEGTGARLLEDEQN